MYTRPNTTLCVFLLLAVIFQQSCRKATTLEAPAPGTPATLKSVSYTGDCFTGYEVSFTCKVTGDSAYLWDFGDGTTSTLPAPIHIFNDTGNFKVKLVLNNNVRLTKELTIRIERSVKHISLVTGTRVWRHVHTITESISGTSITTNLHDTTFDIRYADPARIYIGTELLVYRPDMSNGDNIVTFEAHNHNYSYHPTSLLLNFRHGTIDSFSFTRRTPTSPHSEEGDYFYAP